MQDLVLANLPSAGDDERLQVVLTRDPAGGTRLSLEQQSWAEGVGWFTQSAVELTSEQVRQLRATLGASAGSLPRPRRADLAPGDAVSIPFPAACAESA